MGNCFSDPSSEKKPKSSKPSTTGPGQRLGSAPSQGGPVSGQALSAGQATLATPAQAHIPGRVIGDGYEDGNRAQDPREMARLAAEKREKENAQRGVSSSNPKSGQLSAKLAADKKKPLIPSNRDENSAMDARNWN